MINPDCPQCKGEGWVCENHSDKQWPDECDCGAGAPCICNPGTRELPPDLPPRTVHICGFDWGSMQ